MCRWVRLAGLVAAALSSLSVCRGMRSLSDGIMGIAGHSRGVPQFRPSVMGVACHATYLQTPLTRFAWLTLGVPQRRRGRLETVL